MELLGKNHFLLKGMDLARLQAQLKGSMSVNTNLKIMVIFRFKNKIHAIDAIEKVHDSGIIHRDLKPVRITINIQANFVLSQDKNKVMLVDFGLAKTFVQADGLHKPEKLTKKFKGTLMYASENAHQFKVRMRNNTGSLKAEGMTLCPTSTCSWNSSEKNSPGVQTPRATLNLLRR